VTKPPTCKDVFQWESTVLASAKKKNVAAIIAMEMIQKDIATPSFGDKKASSGFATGFVLDMGAPIAADNTKLTRCTQDLHFQASAKMP
jgi:hypothetical protein